MAKIDLSGIWNLSCDKPDFQTIPAQIPGENCTALIDAGILPDPNIGFNEKVFQWIRKYDWTWNRKFEVSADFLKQKRIWLNIDSLDTVGEIRINGKTVLHSRNMFCRIRREVSVADPMVTLTEHPSPDGTLEVVAVNNAGTDKTVGLKWRDALEPTGCLLGGSLQGNELALEAHSGAILRFHRKS